MSAINWPVQQNPTNPSAVPVLDGWGWDEYWDIEDWMRWHMALVTSVGREEANRRFLSAWNEQGLGASPLSARTFDSAFKAYAAQQGFADGLYRNAYGFNAVLEPAGDAISAVKDVSSGVATAGTVLKYALPVMILGAVGFLLYAYTRKGASFAK